MCTNTLLVLVCVIPFFRRLQCLVLRRPWSPQKGWWLVAFLRPSDQEDQHRSGVFHRRPTAQVVVAAQNNKANAPTNLNLVVKCLYSLKGLEKLPNR